MNRQPYGSPPRWWPPKLSPHWVTLSRRWRHRQLRNDQQLVDIKSKGLKHLRDAVTAGHGVLIAPNHSAHYDSAALYAAADEIDQPLYFMTAWQVFAMSSRFERWAMQRLGCFSIDRESTDKTAFKQAVAILKEEPHPLVIFPEGDIYHTTDRVTPFREGAAAIALSAAKGDRPIVVIPCAIRFQYVDDPTEQLHELLTRLEERLYLRPLPASSLQSRIHRFAEAALALKELDYLGRTSQGRLRDRVNTLIETVLTQLESRHGLRSAGRTPPERVKDLRRKVIAQLELATNGNGDQRRYQQLQQDMEDIFFVMQCFSYPGDYLSAEPSIERLAETADKFEEDVLGVDVPTVRGRRKVQIAFGEPIPVVRTAGGRGQTTDLTDQMQQSVQHLLSETAPAAPPNVPQNG